jgi:hypothetical protein
MAVSFDTQFRNEAIAALSALYEGGTVDILDAGAAVLVTLTVPASAFAAAANGSASLASSIQATIAASGAAASYRATTAAGGIETGSVTATGGGGDMTLDDVNLVANGTCTITSWTNTYPTGA